MLAASIAINLLALALPLALIQIYDRVIPHQNLATLTALAGLLAVAVLGELKLRGARDRMLTHAAARWEVETNARLHRSLVSGDLDRLQRDGVGALLDRMQAVDAVRAHRSGPSAAALLDVPFALLFLGVLATIAWKVAAAVALLIALTLLASRRVTRANEGLADARSRLETRRNAFLLEALAGMAAVKSLGIAEALKRRHERLCASAAALTEAISANALIAQGAAGAAAQAAPAVAAAAAAMMVLDGAMSLGGMAACILLASRVVQPVMKLESLVAGEMATRRREADVQALAALASDAATEVEAATCAPATTVTLDGVAVRPELGGMTRLEAAFAADEAPGAPLIADVSFSLSRGRMTALSGASGSGKTALLSVIAGRLAPSAGRLAFEDADGRAAAAPRIAFLPQAPTLLEGTVLDNMTRFRPDLHLEEAMSLAAALGIDQFFARHPMGLMLRIRRGVEPGMPAAVAQGVALIGGLIDDPDIVLFDEANLSLDAETDARLLALILARRERCMTLIATQRPSWRRMCDAAFRIEGGGLQPDLSHRPPLRLTSPIARKPLPDGAAGAAA
ncbi:MAG: ABC transporter transmembrane domain-containing protein [Pseudomonadota bacterium]